MPLSAPGQIQSVSSLIPSEVAFYPFNLAEPYAFVRLDSDKLDNLRPDGDYDELAICSLFHDKNYCTLAVRTIGFSYKHLPSVAVKKSRHPFRDRCLPHLLKSFLS